jgi:hypothetical protein
MDTLLGTNRSYYMWLNELKRRDGDNWLKNGRLELAEKTQ